MLNLRRKEFGRIKKINAVIADILNPKPKATNHLSAYYK